MDWVLKPALYAKAAIPFYWMIEIDRGITVHTHRLDIADEPWQINIPITGLRPRNL